MCCTVHVDHTLVYFQAFKRVRKAQTTFKMEKLYKVGWMIKVDLGGVGTRDKYDQNIMYRILKELMKHDKSQALKHFFCIFNFVISISCYLFLKRTNKFKFVNIAFAVKMLCP